MRPHLLPRVRPPHLRRGLALTRTNEKRAVYYRRLTSGSLDIGSIHAVEGDFINATAIHGISSIDRKRLGPVLSMQALRRIVGTEPEEGQVVFRAVTAAPASSHRPGLVVIGPVEGRDIPVPYRTAPPDPPKEGWVTWARDNDVAAVLVTDPGLPDGILAKNVVSPLPDGAKPLPAGHLYRPLAEVVPFVVVPKATPFSIHSIEDDANGIVLIDEDAFTDIALLLTVLLPVYGRGVDVVFPVHNLGGEPCLPMSGDSGSSHQRLPGGLSDRDISLALMLGSRGAVEAAPRHPCAAFVTPQGLAKLKAGERLSRAVTALDAFVRRDVEKEGPTSRLLGFQDALPHNPPTWPETHRRLYSIISASRPRGLPVAVYSHAMGPMGGPAVLVHMADGLRDYGFASYVLFHTLQEHDFRPRVSFRKVRNSGVLRDDPAKATGHDHGLLVASHWSSGEAVRALRDRYVATTIVQDREDWFAGLRGQESHLRPHQYADYLAIDRGGAVARWIIDTMVQDFNVTGDNYEVIPSGVNLGVFHPPAERRARSTVRILAMWRPSTAKRRGIARLKALYEALHRRYRGAISLELFGWGDGAPPFATSHGRLPAHEVAALMRQVDIVVEPSEFQGFGLPGIEAMACGAALVSTDCRGPAEYIVDGENAIMVPHDNLEDGVRRVIEDEALRRRLQATAPGSIRRHGEDVVVAQWARHLARLWRAEGAGHRGVCDRAEEQASELLGPLGL